MNNIVDCIQYLLDLDIPANEVIYLYEGHMGGIFHTTEELEGECPQCGDCDYIIFSGTYAEILKWAVADLFEHLRINKDSKGEE